MSRRRRGGQLIIPRSSYLPSVLLKLYLYCYVNRGRNVWLLGRLVLDHKTVADFRRDNGRALREVCARFSRTLPEMGLLVNASVTIDGSKFKAGNNRDRNFISGLWRRQCWFESSPRRQSIALLSVI